MLRPNYAMDEPPTGITVGGSFYPVQTDYRVWLDAVRRIKEIRANLRDLSNFERLLEAAKQTEELETLLFGGTLADENSADVLAAVSAFATGYPAAPYNGGDAGAATYSFDYDLNEIIIAIKNQHGVDCSYRNPSVHWWEFLLLFHTLSGDHYILHLMETRGYKGTDKEMLRRKQAAALPEELTKAEQEELDAWAAEFDALDKPAGGSDSSDSPDSNADTVEGKNEPQD